MTYNEYISSLLTQILIAIWFLTIITNSLINLSSPIGAFILINQFQLLFLIIVSGAFLSNGVFYLIVGMNIVLFNFEFIKIEHIENIKDIYYDLSFDQPNSHLSDIGIPSGSTYVNNIKLVIFILLAILAHLFFIMIFRWFKWTDRYRIWIRVYNLLFTFFTFSIYIRMIIEAYFMMLLSSFSEVYEHDLSSVSRTTSFYINIAILISLLIVLGIWISQILKAHPTLNLQKQKYFVEFFNGIRNTTYSRINSVLFLIQRILGWSVVIFLVDSSLVIKLSIITVIQVLYLTYLLIVRPYEERKDLFSWIY